MCLFGIHNANYIVNSIVCAVTLVRGSRVPAYRIWPMHGPIYILDMHEIGTKHNIRHSQKSGVQWSGVAKFTCITLGPVCSIGVMLGCSLPVISAALLSLRIRLKRIEHAYWLQAGFIS